MDPIKLDQEPQTRAGDFTTEEEHLADCRGSPPQVRRWVVMMNFSFLSLVTLCGVLLTVSVANGLMASGAPHIQRPHSMSKRQFSEISSFSHWKNTASRRMALPPTGTQDSLMNITKEHFLQSLTTLTELNSASPEISQIVSELCTQQRTNTALSPEGEWRVVYAPHMSTMGEVLFNSRFAPVIYQFPSPHTIVSHARVELSMIAPVVVWLSASGTIAWEEDSSDNKPICSLVFDQTWLKVVEGDDFPHYYPTLKHVPDSWSKSIINAVGRLLFIEPFAKFPVAYADQDLVVFDFELFGTRICAKKQQ